MKAVKIMIQKATTVPTKRGLIHKFRTDWQKIKIIDYDDCERYFKDIGDNEIGLGIVYDSQFAKWLVDNFGLGRYHIIIWGKGTPGFTFINFDCRNEETFVQLAPKKQSKINLSKKYNRYAQMLNSKTLDEIEKRKIKEKMDKIKDISEIDEIIADEEYAGGNSTYSRYRKIHLLKNTPYVYKPHPYKEYGEKAKIEELKNQNGVKITSAPLINRIRGVGGLI